MGTRCHTLRLSFQDRMSAHHNETCDFWKEDAKKASLLLRSVHSNDRDIQLEKSTPVINVDML